MPIISYRSKPWNINSQIVKAAVHLKSLHWFCKTHTHCTLMLHVFPFFPISCPFSDPDLPRSVFPLAADKRAFFHKQMQDMVSGAIGRERGAPLPPPSPRDKENPVWAAKKPWKRQWGSEVRDTCAAGARGRETSLWCRPWDRADMGGKSCSSRKPP